MTSAEPAAVDVSSQANEAASHWNGKIIRMIRNRENAVYEMEAPGGRAALRLHRPGYQQDAAIRSELWWCAGLAEAGVAVPSPLATTQGATLVRLRNGRCASAMTWLQGNALGEAGQPFQMPRNRLCDMHRQLGRLIARVHAATDGLILPPDFTRPSWDSEGLVGEAPLWGRFWDHPAASDADRAVLLRARHVLRDGLAAVRADGGDFGLIHADVLRENVLVNDHSLSLIDFDDSGFGFRLYDLGTVMSQNLYEPYYTGIRDALIEGYGETRKVSVEHVELFILARTCASVGWTMPRLSADNPVHQSHIARAVMWAQHILAQLQA